MNEAKVIGENTMLRLGLVITVMSGVTAFTWWASSVNSALNTLLAGQRRDTDNSRILQGRVETLERASDMFTQVGSPALRPRLESLERWREQVIAVGTPPVVEIQRRLTVVEREFELHKQSAGKEKQ